ncbi:hypothetical protein XENOCAPTIV_016581 [Xenoophorus captivus]|uniref:Serpin B6 n=1 Tax=Xenoophorus captivus TaxID=1517983 RepID=A0ABV0QJR8_9TELE
MVPQGVLDHMARMVLVNAIYFKGTWDKPFERFETYVAQFKLSKWTHPDKMESLEVDVSLPRFKMEEKYDLNEVLSSMGMVDAFKKSKCDFSEAAAATACFVTMDCIRILPKFTADHPFLFFIRHNPTVSILFAGRLCSPE